MPWAAHKLILQRLTVKEAMRRQVVRLPPTANLAEAVRAMLKYKVNAVLISADAASALGVVSKTDLMTAYYSGLPLGTLVKEIMVGPPRFCQLQDSLDTALTQMEEYRIHRLYVVESPGTAIIGVLAYPDIVGLIYRYCRQCDCNLNLRGPKEAGDLSRLYRVKEIMSPNLVSYPETASISEIISGLAAYRVGAIPIRNTAGTPVGVVSKTDLVLAYLHALPLETTVSRVMNMPIVTCDQEALLLEVIRKMIFSDLHRIFVYQSEPEKLVGVLSLSDAARFRSGSCRACLVSRINP